MGLPTRQPVMPILPSSYFPHYSSPSGSWSSAECSTGGPASKGLPHGGQHRPPLCCLEGRASPGAHSEAPACWPGSNSFVRCPVPGWSSKGWVFHRGHPGDPFPSSQPDTCCSLQEDNRWVGWDASSSSRLGVQCPPGAHTAASPCSNCLPAMPEVATSPSATSAALPSPAHPSLQPSTSSLQRVQPRVPGSPELLPEVPVSPELLLSTTNILHSPHQPRPRSTRPGSLTPQKLN